MPDPRPQLGAAGERLAERFLRRRGWTTVARRHRSAVGEIDLIMRDGETLVFVEVKTRSGPPLGEPEHAVNDAKRRRLARCARAFLNERRIEDRPCRFDVVSVVVEPTGEARLTHFPDAFAPARG